MTLLLFLTGLTTVASTGGSSSPGGGLFAVSGGGLNDQFQVTSVSYTYAATSKRTE